MSVVLKQLLLVLLPIPASLKLRFFIIFWFSNLRLFSCLMKRQYQLEIQNYLQLIGVISPSL